MLVICGWIHYLCNMKNPHIELAKEIRQFLSKFAVLNPNRENDDDEKYTSPDAYQLLYCAECFENDTIPTRCWSEWSGGGYRPYTSTIGLKLHNLLIEKIYSVINEGKNRPIKIQNSDSRWIS